MSTVLVTGFGPFAEHGENPSAQAVAELAARWAGPGGVKLVTAVLPVSFARSTTELADLIARHRPAVIVGVGLAAGARRIALERVAVNLIDARIPDIDGAQPVDQPVLPDQPVARLTTLPVKAALRALHEAGLPAELSLSAGSYVCNAMMYTGLASAADGAATGFVHVPPADVVPVADAASALEILLHTVLTDPVDIVVPAGQEH